MHVNSEGGFRIHCQCFCLGLIRVELYLSFDSDLVLTYETDIICPVNYKVSRICPMLNKVRQVLDRQSILVATIFLLHECILSACHSWSIDIIARSTDAFIEVKVLWYAYFSFLYFYFKCG